ncbi:MAG: hypothetical protein K2X66_05650 [Cyanobacteria bacterium]|nr:hypothetical protein [Cyanobacteriota bacterium]
MNPMTPSPQFSRYFSGFTLLYSLVLFNLFIGVTGDAAEPSTATHSLQGLGGNKGVQDQIDLANQWAKNGEYAKAIAWQEQVRRQLPAVLNNAG